MALIESLFIFSLYKVTEKIWEKSFDAAWEPVGEGLKERFFRWAGKDKESQRQAAFAAAADSARERTVRQMQDQEQVERVLQLLDQKTDRRAAMELAEEAAKLMLFSDEPNVERMTAVIQKRFHWQEIWSGETPPPDQAVAEVVTRFLGNLREALLDQEPYENLIQKEMLRELRRIAGPEIVYDTRETYLEQLMDRHRDLDFVGIPELKDRQATGIEDVFIHLQAETSVQSHFTGSFTRSLETGTVVLSADFDENTGGRRGEVEATKRRQSINEALRENMYLVVLGDPGAGKTTLLKYIVLAFAQGKSEHLGLNEERLPVFVRLYDYVAQRMKRQHDYSLVDYLYTQAHENLLLNLEPGFFEGELKRGSCCVCLDGLDELGAAGLRRDVTMAVASLANRYRQNRFIITSRVVGYGEAPLDRREFTHFTVLDLTDDDIKRFVWKWYRAREKDPVMIQERVEHLTQTIMNEQSIRLLAANPLMLTIIALVHRIEAELPHERVKLYEKCVTALLETWERVKGLDTADRNRPYYKKRRQLLEQLAYWMHTQFAEKGRVREIHTGDLVVQLADFLRQDPNVQLDKRLSLQEAVDFVSLMRMRHGLLVERGEGSYTFAHLTFQEYMTASYIKYEYVHNIEAMWTLIKPHLHAPHWREVILLLLGSLNEFRKHPTELVHRIVKNRDKYEDVLHRHLFLAARALADRVEVDVNLRDQVVDQLLEIFRSGEPAHDDALAVLGTLAGNKRAAVGLLALAWDEGASLEIRRRAAEGLGWLGNSDEAAEVLLTLTQDEQNGYLQQSETVMAIGRLGLVNEAVLSRLLALSRNKKVNMNVRSNAVSALGQLGQANKVVLSELLALVRDEGLEEGVRSDAVSALGKLGRTDEVMLTDLLALAQDENLDVWVRHHVVSVLKDLGRTGELASTWVRHEELDASVFDLEILDKDENFTSQSAFNLSPPTKETLVSALLSLVGTDTDETVGVLLALVRDQAADGEVLRAAANEVRRFGRADGVAEVALAVAKDEEIAASARSAAANVLGLLGWADEATEILLALGQDERMDAQVRSGAAYALEHLGHVDKAAGILLALARDERLDVEVRSASLEALGQLGQADEVVLSRLLILARDKGENALVRRGAYRSLKVLLGGESGDMKHET